MAKPIDGYLVDDLIVYRGLQKGGYVGRGFRIHPPDGENADVGWLNRLEDEMRVLLASLKDTARMQFHWSVDSDYQRELLAYYAKTKEQASNEWSKLQRNERFTRYWRLMEQRQLRRERLNIYITSKVDAGALPKDGGKRKIYDFVLGTIGRELDGSAAMKWGGCRRSERKASVNPRCAAGTARRVCCPREAQECGCTNTQT